jgi:hypothetical protein
MFQASEDPGSDRVRRWMAAVFGGPGWHVLPAAPSPTLSCQKRLKPIDTVRGDQTHDAQSISLPAATRLQAAGQHAEMPIDRQ